MTSVAAVSLVSANAHGGSQVDFSFRQHLNILTSDSSAPSPALTGVDINFPDQVADRGTP